MEKLTTVEKVLHLVDMLTTELDEYIREHETLQDAYQDLQAENESLRDALALQMNANESEENN